MEEEKSRPTMKKIEVVLRDLENLLRETLGSNLIVDAYKTTNLVPQGENYGSTMLKVDAEIRRDGKDCKLEKLFLVAKMVPPTEFQKEMFQSPLTFGKEIYMFTQIIPAFKALERECGIPENDVFDPIPKLFGSRLSIDQPEDKFDHDAVILMENLKLKNYYCDDRMIGVDLAHASSVVETLARFHALGIALKEKKPKLFEKIKDHATYLAMDDNMAKQLADYVINSVKKVPSLLPHLGRIEKVIREGISDFCVSVAPDEPWGTIVHKDFWVNNVMFKDNANGDPEDVKFVDFQHYTYENPLRDLIFFLFTSCKAEVRTANIKDLVDLYYKKFTSHLVRLKCDIHFFTRDSFDKQFSQIAKLEYLHCVFFLRVITVDHVDSNTDTTGGDIDLDLFESEPTDYYLERINEVSLIFIEENWI